MIKWILPSSIILCGIGAIILGIQLKDYKYPSQIQKEFIEEFNNQWEQLTMTEKRFNVIDVDGTIFLEDHNEGSYHIGLFENIDVNCLNDIADKLNVLSTENKELKKQLQSEHTMLDNAILLERTRMGQSALKQYKEAIQ